MYIIDKFRGKGFAKKVIKFLLDKTISVIIIKLNNERILYHPSRGKWNIHENIAHLARYQLVFIERIHKILTIEEPEFGAYKAEEDKEFEFYCAFTTYELLKKI